MNFAPHRLRALPLAVAASIAILAAPEGRAQTQEPINIVINQSPWLEGFANLVDLYEEETGNSVTLDVNPYAGSLEKQRNAVRASESEYDLLIVNGIFYPEMYKGGFLEPLTNIDPDFELDPQVYSFDETPWYDAETDTVNAETGELMTVPVNPNITMMFYRADLYEKHGLEIPDTWEELLANAKVIQ